MVTRGILNKKAFRDLSTHVSTSGLLRAREATPNGFIYDVNGPVVQMQKTSVLVAGAGRLVIAKGANYVPSYTMAIGTSVGSGYTVPSDGIYLVDAEVAVSGVAIETFAGSVLVNGVAASGTASFAGVDARGAASIHVRGIVHAYAGQVLNIGVKSLHSTLTTIGVEDLVHAPAANLTVIKLPSDQLTNTGS